MALSLKAVQDAKFKRVVMPYVEYGFNLALSLLQNRSDAEDAIQEASVKAYQSVWQLRGEDSRAWFLRIVRNECMNILRTRSQARGKELSFDDEIEVVDQRTPNPVEVAEGNWTRAAMNEAIGKLSIGLREVLVLREIEGLSYQQIAEVTGTPIGTVMSRLSRARTALLNQLSGGETCP